MRRLFGAVLGLVAVGTAALPSATLAQQGTIRVTAPANGATVSGPVTVQVAIGGVVIKPATDGDLDAFHYHIFVDVDPTTVTQAGQPIPTGQANIIHTADLNHALGELPPGPHTVYVMLTKTNHIPLTPAVQDRVTFTVAAAGGAAQTPPAGTPRTGAGVSAGAAPLPLALALAPIVAGALLLAVRRRRLHRLR